MSPHNVSNVYVRVASVVFEVYFNGAELAENWDCERWMNFYAHAHGIESSRRSFWVVNIFQ